MAGFIMYSPSYDPYKGSLVEIIEFEQSETFIDKGFQEQELSVQKENHFSVPKLFEVELYFNERDLPSAEAHQFYSFYDAQNWKLSGGKLMKCWQAAARRWISRGGRTGS
ncbi:hypothetical protein KB553_09470 [Chryseobacterium rhizoplanae]|uniref:hypothetical protein n=1 Tax=Chryseobacterium rhizoplanae TaxID=1609531 RepID=UPI001CE23760|nr:hypothetical protein [Chryseobacterium rhizoplanae]UCA61743.1 hypothetical protein KB553_09470 [Chryseobacterium rhizoplanae]